MLVCCKVVRMHIPVLTKELMDGLDIKKDDVVMDVTLGGGGHSRAVCERLGKRGMLVGMDADGKAIERARKKLQSCLCPVILSQSNFRHLDTVAFQHNVSHVDKLIFDLGMSSFQLETPDGENGRGFSFQKDEPLLMTFDERNDAKMTALDLLAAAGEEALKTIIVAYGEEKYAGRIARAIVAQRKKQPILTTCDLVDVICIATPLSYQRGKRHFATRTFQALRMAVNDEIEALQEGLAKGFMLLAPRGRMAVISFHSIEDRIVKFFFRKQAQEGNARLYTKKPIRPEREEIADNPRSRSAHLRILEKIS